MRATLVSLCALLFAAVAHAVSATGGNRLLVLLDDVAEKEGYSQMLGDLEGRGFKITYETPKSESLQLFHLGERTYDHVLLFPSKAKSLGPNLTPNILIKFMNADGNILLTTSSSRAVPTSLASLLIELDISIPAERTGVVVDHFNYDTVSAADKHDVLALPGFSRAGVKTYFTPETQTEELIAVPSAVGHVLGPNALLSPILRAPGTAYSYNPKEQSEVLEADELFAAGQQLAIVSGFQARNSARLAFVGSAEMFSNAWFDAKVKKVGGEKVKTWNREFAKRVTGWVFQELGVLRVNSIEHRRNEVGESDEINPKMYMLTNNVTYAISISEYSWDKWTPFVVPEGDELQLEFSMLSPFWRQNLDLLESTADASVFGTGFQIPDQHGIFNFMVNYKRSFLTYLEEKNTVTIRHRAHNEWPRSFTITSAWPWVSGIYVTIAGFLAFVTLWLYSAPPKAVSQKKRQ